MNTAANQQNLGSDNMKAEKTEIPDIDAVLAAPKGGKGKKLSVERIYQKKTQHEHILLRPDTYIGSVEKTTQVVYFKRPVVFSQVSTSYSR